MQPSILNRNDAGRFGSEPMLSHTGMCTGDINISIRKYTVTYHKHDICNKYALSTHVHIVNTSMGSKTVPENIVFSCVFLDSRGFSFIGGRGRENSERSWPSIGQIQVATPPPLIKVRRCGHAWAGSVFSAISPPFICDCSLIHRERDVRAQYHSIGLIEHGSPISV